MRRLLLCCAALLMAGAAQAALQFPALTGRVVDGAHILSPSAQQQLTAQSAALEAKTTDQLVVVTVPSLNGQAIEDYGYQLGRHWGIGQKGKDNGVLLIVAPNEHKVRIEVGYGLEGTLTDAESSLIIGNIIVPAFKRGQMEQGIINGADAVVTLLKGGSLPQLQQSRATNDANGPVAWIIIVILLVLFSQLILFMIYSAMLIVALFLSLFGFNALRRWLDRKKTQVMPADKAFLAWMLMPSTRFTGSGGGSFSGGSRFSGGGGSFGGGGSSGSW